MKHPTCRGSTPDPERGSAQSGQKEKEKRGPRKGRCGMSQGTVIREPRYGGGAHPKYRSCKVLVSLIPRTEVWRGCTPEVLKLYGGGVPNILFPSHGLFGYLVE